MAKRQLTRRQAWRIEKIQAEKAKRAQRRGEQADQLGAENISQEHHGLVIAHYGTQVAVESLDGPLQGQVQRAHIRANIDNLVTGDKVIWQASDEIGVVTAKLERLNSLRRPDAYGQLKTIAANIDQILIVVAVEPMAWPNLIDRYLVAAEASDIAPIIVLNKYDQITGHSDEQRLTAMLNRYEKIGYRVLRTSTKDATGTQELETALVGKTTVFVGQSGVGKSSLINKLLPNEDLKVGALSEAKAKGKHTTTTASLYHFPAGGELIDSPGIREFGLWKIDAEDILQGYREFRPYLGLCQFRDCAHDQEPKCALRDALKSGSISQERWNSYLHLINSL